MKRRIPGHSSQSKVSGANVLVVLLTLAIVAGSVLYGVVSSAMLYGAGLRLGYILWKENSSATRGVSRACEKG
jgi:hypothetical protein